MIEVTDDLVNRTMKSLDRAYAESDKSFGLALAGLGAFLLVGGLVQYRSGVKKLAELVK